MYKLTYSGLMLPLCLVMTCFFTSCSKQAAETSDLETIKQNTQDDFKGRTPSEASYPESPLREMANAAFIDDFVEGLYIAGNFIMQHEGEDFSNESVSSLTLIVYNDYRLSNGLDPITALPYDVVPGDITVLPGMTANFLEVIAEVENMATPFTDFITLYESIEGYAAHLHYSNYSTEEVEHIATFLYAMEIYLYPFYQYELGNRWFPGFSFTQDGAQAYGEGVKCVTSVWAGAVLGSIGGPLGAIAGGVLAANDKCW